MRIVLTDRNTDYNILLIISMFINGILYPISDLRLSGKTNRNDNIESVLFLRTLTAASALSATVPVI